MKSFGAGPVPLPKNCKIGSICFGYGPPLPYSIPNQDGAIGGNPAVSPFLMGGAVSPQSDEIGWKDTVKVFPGEILRIIIRVTQLTYQDG